MRCGDGAKLPEMQEWKKHGLLFGPNEFPPWVSSHASVPIPEVIDDNTVRVYFSGRDQHQRSRPGNFTFELSSLQVKPRSISEQPLMELGSLGSFDEDGVMASCLVPTESTARLYYIGWNKGVTVPFRNSIGLAQQLVEGGFSRQFSGPILERSALEPHFVASCFVHKASPVNWKMWYLSCTEWTQTQRGPRHRYHIKYAESSDGINWNRDGIIAIDYKDDDEYAISRPWVIRDGEVWKMWFSARGKRYRIGYAESGDGVCWERLDHKVGIDVSNSGWDSDMIEYPALFDLAGSRWMLYNGNGYGRSGIGIAELRG